MPYLSKCFSLFYHSKQARCRLCMVFSIHVIQCWFWCCSCIPRDFLKGFSCIGICKWNYVGNRISTLVVDMSYDKALDFIINGLFPPLMSNCCQTKAKRNAFWMENSHFCVCLNRKTLTACEKRKVAREIGARVFRRMINVNSFKMDVDC